MPRSARRRDRCGASRRARNARSAVGRAARRRQSVRRARLPVGPGAARLPARRAAAGRRAHAGVVRRRRRSSPRRPAYLKRNSHGEFVFDHAWAQAYAQHGLDVLPEMAGARCPTRRSPGRACWRAMTTRARAGRGDRRDACARPAGRRRTSISIARSRSSAPSTPTGLPRIDVQYHWRQSRRLGGLRRLPRRAGPQAPQEHPPGTRARSRAPACRFRVVHGDEASDDDLAAMHGFYLQTFHDYGNTPALTLEFFRHLARDDAAGAGAGAGRARRRRTIAGALCLRGGDTLYGRYWGATRAVPGLHFETCYYQGIDYCLREGLARFEPGAQGEHKIARGFLPTLVHSRHWIADPAFADAIARTGARRKRASVRALPRRARDRIRRSAGRHDARACPCCSVPIRTRRFRRCDCALREPDGLLAVGGDLVAVPRLLDAYRHGIFPWFSRGPADPVVVARSAHGVPHRRRAPVVAVPPRAAAVAVDACGPTRAFDDVIAACARIAAAGPARHLDHAGDASPPTSSCTGSAMRTASRCSTAQRAGRRHLRRGDRRGCSSAKACSAPNRAARRSRWPPSPVACSGWGWPLIDAQVENAHLRPPGRRSAAARDFLAHRRAR